MGEESGIECIDDILFEYNLKTNPRYDLLDSVYHTMNSMFGACLPPP